MYQDDNDPPGMIPLPFGCFCVDLYVDTYCMLIHLSLLFPGFGLFVPIVLWICNKDRSAKIDQNGKAAVNWIISFCLYFAFFLVLLLYCPFLVRGLPFWLIAYYLFPVLAAVKAHRGDFGKYPLCIPFFR